MEVSGCGIRNWASRVFAQAFRWEARRRSKRLGPPGIFALVFDIQGVASAYGACLLQLFWIARLRGSKACQASTARQTFSVLAYFQSSTTPLPPHVVARIWAVSYFGLLWDDLLCIDSTFVEDY